MEKITKTEYYDLELTLRLIGHMTVLCLHGNWRGTEPLNKFFNTRYVDLIKIDAIGLSANGINVEL